jgi:hypothetical protein
MKRSFTMTLRLRFQYGCHTSTLIKEKTFVTVLLLVRRLFFRTLQMQLPLFSLGAHDVAYVHC